MSIRPLISRAREIQATLADDFDKAAAVEHTESNAVCSVTVDGHGRLIGLVFDPSVAALFSTPRAAQRVQDGVVAAAKAAMSASETALVARIEKLPGPGLKTSLF